MAKKSEKKRTSEEQLPVDEATPESPPAPGAVDEEYADELIERSIVGDAVDPPDSTVAEEPQLPEHFEEVTPEEQPSSSPELEDVQAVNPPVRSEPPAANPYETPTPYDIRPLRSGAEDADWFQSFRSRLLQSAAPQALESSAAEPEGVAEHEPEAIE